MHELRRRVTNLSDRHLPGAVSALLLALSAWPLALGKALPYQDLPNHLAAVTVIQNLDLYPEFVFNGLAKTNSALFAWLLFVGRCVGLQGAARLFAFGVLAANAFVLPRFVLALTGSRKRMLVASTLMWPMVHNWFVSAGMLDFALAVPLSLAVLIVLQGQRHRPTLARGLSLVALTIVTWYAHVFPLLVVQMLVAIEVVVAKTPAARVATARAMIPPLLPATLLVVVSLHSQMRDTVGPMTGFANYQKILPVWELAYNLWAEWFWAFSKFTVTSVVPCVLLAWLGFSRRRESPPFFSPLALFVLLILYAFVPYIATNWFHVNSRFIPFLWVALLLRVPPELPRKTVAVLGLSAIFYSVGMGKDFVRLERERLEFTAGIPTVPERARLLPLLFRMSASSDNTRSLLHYWAYYVMEKHTAAPLLFAHSYSFPVMYREPPPRRFNHLPLEGFAPSTARPGDVCSRIFDGNVVVNDCDAAFRQAWFDFWAEATPLFDHLLLWEVTPEARALIPAVYHPVFERGRLAIYARLRTDAAR